jgi:hypothetical protein
MSSISGDGILTEVETVFWGRRDILLQRREKNQKDAVTTAGSGRNRGRTPIDLSRDVGMARRRGVNFIRIGHLSVEGGSDPRERWSRGGDDVERVLRRWLIEKRERGGQIGCFLVNPKKIRPRSK